MPELPCAAERGAQYDPGQGSWLRSELTALIDQLLSALRDLGEPFRSLPDEELRPPLEGYLESLVQCMERDSAEPLIAFFETLVPIWDPWKAEVANLVRAAFVVTDICRSSLAWEDSEFLRAFDRWNQEAVALLSQHAFSLATGQLTTELQQQRDDEERLLSLQRVSSAILSELDLDRTLEIIVEEAKQLMQADAAAIRLVDEETQTLRLLASAGDMRSPFRDVALPIKGSLSGYCLRSRKPVISDSVRDDPRLSVEIRGITTLRSLLIVPLIVRDDTIGVLLVMDRTPGSFGVKDEWQLELFANHAATAIENARLYQQAQQKIAELAVLQRISNVISLSLDLDEVFEAIYHEIQGVLAADAFLIALAREDGTYDLDFVMDGGRRYAPRHQFEFSPAFDTTVTERRPLLISDVHDETLRRLYTVGHPQTRVRSIIAAPLVKGAKVVGLISAQSYTPDQYRESDAQLLMMIGHHVVVAIDNARLYHQAEHLAVAEERNRLAREIHDTLAQGLVGIILYLERLDLLAPDDQRVRECTQRALSLARGSLEEARRSVQDLRAMPLEGRTLVEALDDLVEDLRGDGSFSVSLCLPLSMPMLAPPVETALFRIVQEAVANCRKHARATHVAITLDIDDHDLVVEVVDDGCGFDAATTLREEHRFGLSTMRERVARMSGTFSIESTPGAGTRVRAVVPLQHALSSEAGS